MSDKKRMVITIIDPQTQEDAGVCSRYYAELNGGFPPKAPQMCRVAFATLRALYEREIRTKKAAQPAQPAQL